MADTIMRINDLLDVKNGTAVIKTQTGYQTHNGISVTTTIPEIRDKYTTRWDDTYMYVGNSYATGVINRGFGAGMGAGFN